MTLTQDWTALRERPDLGELLAAERTHGRRLIADGSIVRIWRLPGRRANIGIWQAEDATQLDDVLAELPLRPWLTAEVVPLALHPLERA